MTLPNIRRNAAEAHHYDPKQRLVGGIVLVLIMLLIYSILKILLGYAPSAQGKYALHDPLPDEITAEEVRVANNTRTVAAIVPPTNSSTLPANNPAAQVTSRAAPVEKSNVLLPVGFVFLDINGKPMQHEVNPLPDSATSSTPAKPEVPVEEAPPSDGKKWAIQVASFNDDKRAQGFVQKLKDKNIAAEVVKAGRQHTVRLTPVLDSRRAAEIALQKVREQINVKGLILQAGQ
ncbi:MAG: SPOR domain-containing protein [Thiotrichaceae bacterium]|nr:SPOR domain-containing protein [Thiotrichaceae bacterium]